MPSIQAFTRRKILIFLSIFLSLHLSGCGQALLTAGATAGMVISQERTVGDAIDDTAIALSIKDKLFSKSDELFLRTSIKSIEGRVLLTGSVKLPEDRIEVAKIAWQTTGVKEVYNEIEVRDRSKILDYFNDVRISNELRFRLMREKNVSAINYSVETVNKVVYLMGIAKNQTELNVAVEQARNIKGVEKVLSYVVLKEDSRRSNVNK